MKTTVRNCFQHHMYSSNLYRFSLFISEGLRLAARSSGGGEVRLCLSVVVTADTSLAAPGPFSPGTLREGLLPRAALLGAAEKKEETRLFSGVSRRVPGLLFAVGLC